MSDVESRAAADAAPEPGRARREWLARGAFEAVLIVLSVLLGFAISEWRDRHAVRARAAQALAAVESELDSNRAIALRTAAHHQEVADTLARYLAAATAVPERVHEQQAAYRRVSDAVVNDVYGDVMTRGALPAYRDDAASWQLLVGDWSRRERHLAERFDSALVYVRAARRR